MKRRLTRRLTALTQRVRGQAVGRVDPTTQSRIEQAWVLDDGSLVIEGWCVDQSTLAALEARAGDGDWTPLLRKHRPDVAHAIAGLTAASLGQANYGFVGRLTGQGVASTLRVHMRSGASTWYLPCPQPTSSAIRDELFASLAIDPSDLAPENLLPLSEIMRHAPRPAAPQTELLYEHISCPTHGTVNVVVPLYGQFTYVRNLLLNAATFPSAGCTITFVCDDPTIADDLAAWVRAWNDAVYRTPTRVIAHSANAGFATACNTGSEATSADYQLLLNSDILVDRFGPDIELLRSTVTAGFVAVGPVLTYPDGRLQHAGMELQASDDFPGFVLPMHPGKGEPPDGLPDEAFSVPMLTGAAILLSTRALDRAGGMPIVFGRGDFEDVLLSQRLRTEGPLVIEPRVRWTHVEGASFDRDTLGGVPATLAKSLLVTPMAGPMP